jgi:hypothetical protein
MVKGLDADMGMMPPAGACAAEGGGATFLDILINLFY